MQIPELLHKANAVRCRCVYMSAALGGSGGQADAAARLTGASATSRCSCITGTCRKTFVAAIADCG